MLQPSLSSSFSVFLRSSLVRIGPSGASTSLIHSKRTSSFLSKTPPDAFPAPLEVAIQPALWTSPPFAGYFFGNPVAQVSTSLNFVMMSSLIKKNPAAKPFAKRQAAAPRAVAAPASSASTSTDSRGKGYGRNSRGRRGCRK